MLRKALSFVLFSVVLSLFAAWAIPMIRTQIANGSFDRFMKTDELEPTVAELETETIADSEIAPEA